MFATMTTLCVCTVHVLLLTTDTASMQIAFAVRAFALHVHLLSQECGATPSP